MDLIVSRGEGQPRLGGVGAGARSGQRSVEAQGLVEGGQGKKLG